jgi:transposase
MQITIICLDLAKHVFQVHAVDAEGRVVPRKSMRRAQLLPFFAKLPRCLIGIEACGTSYHWARELTQSVNMMRGLLAELRALLPAASLRDWWAVRVSRWMPV